MGTNFYRIPTVNEIMTRRAKLAKEIENMDIFNISNLNNGFKYLPGDSVWDKKSPWDIFNEDMLVHLGKRSKGWRFCWNFHNNEYYSNKEELLEYIRSGRVVNEEFIKMALEWEQPNGFDTQTYYKKYPSMFDNSEYNDKDIEGLRVSPVTNFF